MISNDDIGTVLITQNLTIREYSSSVIDQFSLKNSELNGSLENFTSKFSKISKKQFISSIKNALLSRSSVQLTIKTDDAKYFWTLISPAFRTSSKLGDLIVSFMKQDRHSGSFNENDEVFKTVFDSAPKSFVILDSRFKIIRYNQALCAMLGYAADELIGKPIDTVITGSRKKFRELNHNSQDRNAPANENFIVFNLNSIGKHSNVIPVEICLAPFFLKEQRYLIAILTDISKRKATEKKLLQQRRDLLKTNKELEQFAYSTSHDLRSPLKTIQGLSEAIDEELKDNNINLAITFNNQVKRGIDRLDKLILDIFEYTKARTQHEKLVHIDFNQLMEDITCNSLLRYSGNNIDLRTKFNHSKKFYSQKVRVFQILSNLISNSYKYYNPNQKKPYIEVATKNLKKNQIEISVKDNGIGIPEDSHNKVFSMFFRCASINNSGTGLGLALVKKHVDSLNGSINFSSSPRGTCFKIVFPLNP